MSAFFMMIGVAVLYAFCNVFDKRGVSKYNLNKNEFTFLICAPLAVVLAIFLPFQNTYFVLSWQAFVAVLLLTLQKVLEFQTCAVILKEVSAFELKAWLGITLVISYFTDLFFDEAFNLLKLLCLLVMIAGLMLIVKSKKEVKIDYKALIIPLILYILAKFGYGLIIKSFVPFISKGLLMTIAHAAAALVFLPAINFKKLFTENRSGVLTMLIARVPNAVALVIESVVVMISLVSYSFIQPLTLVFLFAIDLFKKAPYSRLNLIGSIICILSFLLFQIF